VFTVTIAASRTLIAADAFVIVLSEIAVTYVAVPDPIELTPISSILTVILSAPEVFPTELSPQTWNRRPVTD